MKNTQRNTLRLQKVVLPFYFCDFVYCPGIATEVNGSEGRKDSACSLYSHLEVAPEIIYDFASKPGSIARITMQGISRTHNFLRYLSLL